MTGSAHLKLGIASGALIGIFMYKSGINVPTSIATGVGCVLGGVLPDIDTKQSIASNDLKVTGFIVRHTVGHRGVVHTPIFGLVLSIVIGLILLITPIPVSFAAGLFLGYILHLIQDTFTKRGIMWLFPVSRHYFAVYKVKSGKSSFIETLISTAIFMGEFVIVYGGYLLWCTW